MDQLVYNEDALDNFVKESTRFVSWKEMVRTATDLYFQGAGTPKRRNGILRDRGTACHARCPFLKGRNTNG